MKYNAFVLCYIFVNLELSLAGATSLPGLGDACINHTDCQDINNAECTRERCTCSTGYKTYGIVCINVLNLPCKSQLECTGHLPHSKCDTKCVCETNFTVEANLCKRGPGIGGCSTQSDCVSNAVCNDKKMCICKSSHSADNGLCVASDNGVDGTSTKLLTDIVLVAIILGFIIRLF